MLILSIPSLWLFFRQLNLGLLLVKFSLNLEDWRLWNIKLTLLFFDQKFISNLLYHFYLIFLRAHDVLNAWDSVQLRHVE